MARKLGIRTIDWLNYIFNDYFLRGDIVIAGSFYYKRIGCNIVTQYKDVDLVVDERKDDVFNQIMDIVESKYDVMGGFRRAFDGEPIIGAFHVKGYAPVDVLRNDFTNLRPKIEIIPGVMSHALSDKVLYETYKMLEHKTKEPKYSSIKEFFYERSLLLI